MRFYELTNLERIGFDFYCDIANNIAKARKNKGWTQKELAEKSRIKYSRICKIEGVKTRIDMDDLEKLSEVLSVSVDWLIDADLDSQEGKCLYLVWMESIPDFKLYIHATSKREAFLLYDRKFKKCGVAYSSSRERFFVKLVGVPVSNREFQRRFPKRTEEDLPLEPDKDKEV